MTDPSPAPGTIRYLCPVECGWHHDRPPLPDTWIPVQIAAETAAEAVQLMSAEAVRQDFERVELALREHLATHTTEEFVRTIQELRGEVGALKRAPAVAS